MSGENGASDAPEHKVERLLSLHAETTPLIPHAAATTHRREDYVADKPNEDNGFWKENDTDKALTGLAYDEYLGLKFYHEDPLPRILQACEDSGSMFVDYEFPVHKTAIVYATNEGPPRRVSPGIIQSSNCRDFRSDGPKRAKRIAHFVTCAEKKWTWIRASSFDECALFRSHSQSIDPRNVLQGQVGICGFCSGFASVAAEWPEIIRDAFGRYSESSILEWGAVSVRLFPKGKERYLLLDDYVLCRNDGSQSSPSLHSLLKNDLWIRLLEKVFVKIQGSYASLDGYYKYNSLYRHPVRALQLLTGAPVAMELHYKGRPVQEVYVALLGTQGICARVAHCRKRVNGLHSNHGYSLLWVGEAAGIKMACLRNPHGHGSYTGRYGYGSKAWANTSGESNSNSAVASELVMLQYFEKCPLIGRVVWRRPPEARPQRLMRNGTRATDDGIFFMEFSVFVECFPVVTIVGPLSSTSGSRATSSADCVYQIHGRNLFHVKTILDAAMGEA